MRKICYYPELTTITGSITATLLMSQLEFWFKVTGGKSFYKFMEPCEHGYYKEGDSWQEELMMSSSEIRTAFKRIGIAYKSKKEFMEVRCEDPEKYVQENGRFPIMEVNENAEGDLIIMTGDGSGNAVRYTFSE